MNIVIGNRFVSDFKRRFVGAKKIITKSSIKLLLPGPNYWLNSSCQ